MGWGNLECGRLHATTPSLTNVRELVVKVATNHRRGREGYISVCSESSKASSTSMPRYLTVCRFTFSLSVLNLNLAVAAPLVCQWHISRGFIASNHTEKYRQRSADSEHLFFAQVTKDITDSLSRN